MMEVENRRAETSIGVFPCDWEIQTLNDITESSRPISYGIVQTGDEVSRGVRCIRVVDIKDGLIDDSDLITTSQEISDSYSRTVLREGDAVIALRGKIGEVALIPKHLEGANLTRGVALLAVVETHSGRYVKHFLSSPLGKSILEKEFNGSALQELRISSLRSIKIACPPLPEQRAIADALSDVDALIERLDALIAKKRAIKTATMQRLLTGTQRLPGFDGDWTTKRLGDVMERIVGGGTPSRSNPKYWGGQIPWMTVKDFSTFDPSNTQERITEEGLRNSASNLIPAGTVITSTRMALGAVAVYDMPVAINQDLKALFTTNDVADHFLLYWFQHNAEQIARLGSGSTVKGLSLSDLRDLEFSKPSLEEQQAIAAILSDMDAEIEALQARRDKTQDIKQGMMQELLTGRTRLV